MANIRIDLNRAPNDGETISFKAPCDAKYITGLIIYYPNDNGVTVSQEYTLNDASGSDIGEIDSIFSEGAIVKVILDTDLNNAYVQNPDTNTYLESRFENKAKKEHKHTKSEITDFPTSMTPTAHNHSASEITSGTLAVARGGTGVTSNPSMLTNLGSTTAASVFAASPRPGVTGTLPIANGGTGATTAAAARTSLGLKTENWTFTLEDGSTVTKAVYVG